MQDHLMKLIERQRAYYQNGHTHSYNARIKALKQLKTMLKQHEPAILKALEKDLGKHPNESYLTEIGVTYDSINYMLKHLKSLMKPKRVKTPLTLFPATSQIMTEPLGNSLIMSAFNYPILLSFDPIVGALAGGNTALVALSEYTPTVNQVLLQAISATFDAGLLTFFESSIERNTFVLAQRFDKIFFTGSPKVGKIVYQAASQHLTPVTLELGGKSPALVTANANLTHAAQRIAWGKFINTGQTCVAPDYCLVDRQVLPEFVEALKSAIIALYGQDTKQNKDYGKIVNQAAWQRLNSLLVADASYIVAGGSSDEATRYIEPTLLVADDLKELASMQEEIFGPILPILPFDTIEEAVTIIKGFEQPLAFYPFTANKKEQTYLLDTLSFGGATVNDTILHLANIHLPFGGVGNSGIGHYHGAYSYEAFTHQKAVLKRQTWLTLPVMNAPYTVMKDKVIRKLLK
ncbi:aldehyde dehydrogenase family protein [Vagococcus zengguangii]|uniref:aldehyde dehydrogenase family protein n=1 Tax=Vagococcus zengguangii TaxID=2571750 RepID=UPI001108946E|nr:aldehyde dehydrogenase family protein [Vagococcus zengguangii]TLG81299.1 aldehyde dehydrogenase family protein [Vagococcus zengguangii]